MRLHKSPDPSPVWLHESEVRSTSPAHHAHLPLVLHGRMLAAAIFVHFSTAFDKVIWQTIFGVTFDLNEAVLAKPSAPLSPTCPRLLNTFTPVEVCCVELHVPDHSVARGPANKHLVCLGR